MNVKLIRLAMSWLGVAGVGITSWLSVKCSKKAEKETEPKKKVLAYAPAIASGLATSFCILKPAYMAEKEIAALAAGCAYLAQNKDKLSLPGTDKKEEPQKNDIAPWEGHCIEWTGKGTTMCFDEFSGRMFYSCEDAVNSAVDSLNERYVEGEFLTLNDFYRYLGISRTDFGEEYGWPNEGLGGAGDVIDIRCIHTTIDGQHAILVVFCTKPIPTELR
jgi:hypothetical protein